MKKRGIILIVLVVFILILSVLINADSLDTGCCTNPELSLITCTNTTEAECCTGLLNYTECVNKYFYKGTQCENVENNLCDLTKPGCCINTEDEKLCEYVDLKARCYFRESQDFSEELCENIDICKEGCCFCTDGSKFIFDAIESPIKTYLDCEDYCKAFPVPQEVGYHNTSITSVFDCQKLFLDSYSTAAVSGYIKNLNNQPIFNATIIIDNKNATTNTQGFYQFTNITPSTSKLITISHPVYESFSELNNIKTGTNQINFTLLTTGIRKLNGTITDLSGQPIQGATIKADIKIATTDNSGFYEITGLYPITYSVTAFKSGYLSIAKSIGLVADETLNFTLTKIPTAKLSGYIYGEGEPILGAAIRLDDKDGNYAPLTTISDSNGKFEFENVPVDTTANYIISVTKSGFENYVGEITISEGEDKQIGTIFLTSFSRECGYTKSVAPRDFTANHVKGEKAVLLTWTNPCTTVARYILTKQEQFGKTILDYFEVTEAKQFFQFKDKDVEWGETYTYEVKAIYDNVDPSSAQDTITLGNSKCLNKIGEFCKTRTERARCNDENQVTSEGLIGLTINCSELGETYFCAGPDLNRITYCKDESICGPLVQHSLFGLYTIPFAPSPSTSCYGGTQTQTESYNNYCYYDYSDTIADKCYSCRGLDSCFDYNSDQACLLDSQSCFIGGESGCKWIMINPELGKGICYQESYAGTDKCDLCSQQRVFYNQQCTQEVCSKLGNCFSNEDLSSCIECKDDATCESYKSELACGLQSISFDISGKRTPSDDACGLEVCRWSQNKCFKDGNDDNIADCALDDFTCQEDTIPPITTISEQNLKITAQNSQAGFDVNELSKTVHYCVVSDPDAICNDDDFVTGTFTNRKHIANLNNYKNGNWKIDNINIYYLKFYSIDNNGNREELNTKRFFADWTIPDITVTIEKELKTDKGDLIITILSDELITCTGNLTGTNINKPIDEIVNYQKQINFTNLNFGPYFLDLDCEDFGGNKKKIFKTITLDDYITIFRPLKAIRSETFSFQIKTKESTTCTLYELSASETLSKSPDEKLHTSNPHTFSINQHYNIHKVICGAKEEQISFTVDQLPPETTAVFSTTKEQIERTGNNWVAELDEPAQLELKCADEPDLGFGCQKTIYCLNSTSFCEPDTKYNGKLTISNTTKVCYKSTDRGEWHETIKCGEIGIKQPLGINIITPSYGVSNTPNFDIEIQTKKLTQGCKYSATKHFKYNTTTNQKQIFDMIDNYNYEKTNFPALLWDRNFTAVSPPYTWKNGPYEQYDMYVKCIDSETLEPNDDYPANFKIYYDPTPPKITKSYTSNHLGGPSTSTITGFFAWLNIKTDDETLCKYSKENKSFNAMENSFPGFKLKEFKKIHNTFIEDPKNDKTHKYYIQCMNKAENYSEIKQISFTVDKSKTGGIISANARYRNGTTTFSIETNKKATCSYTVEGKSSDITTVETFSHTAETEEFTEEKRYEAAIRCVFSDTQKSVTQKISFAVDKTSPIMKQVILGKNICNPRQLTPTFIAEDADNLSEIILYNYTIKETGAFGNIIKSGTTSDSTPKIKGLNLDINNSYIMAVSAQDEAGLWSNFIESDEFQLLDKDSIICQDSGPPIVRIEETLNSDGSKNIALICEDENGCSGTTYGTSASKTNCSAFETYYSPVLITETKYICWEAFDTIGNNATGSRQIIIGAEGDSDGDGIFDIDDLCPDTPYFDIDNVITDSGSPNYGCAPDEIDSDGDGMPDYWEIQYTLNPADSSDKFEDPDNDGLTNYEEYLQHTDPTIAEIGDSDNDGVPDNRDLCPNTLFATTVDAQGCPVQITPPPKTKEEVNLYAWILLIIGIILIIVGAIVLYLPKIKQIIKPKPRISEKSVISVRRPSHPITGPKISPIEERRKQILEKVTREREVKAKKRKIFFEVFEKRKPVIKSTPVEKEFKRKEYKPLPEKITIPEKKIEFDKLTRLTEDHLTKRTSPEPILKLTGASKTHFNKLTKLIKERTGITKPTAELSSEQRKEIKNIFSKLKGLKKRK